MTMFEVGALCRAFLFAASTTEVHGLESFVKLLDSRQDYTTRKRGLLTGISAILYGSTVWILLCGF